MEIRWTITSTASRGNPYEFYVICIKNKKLFLFKITTFEKNCIKPKSRMLYAILELKYLIFLAQNSICTIVNEKDTHDLLKVCFASGFGDFDQENGQTVESDFSNFLKKILVLILLYENVFFSKLFLKRVWCWFGREYK